MPGRVVWLKCQWPLIPARFRMVGKKEHSLKRPARQSPPFPCEVSTDRAMPRGNHGSGSAGTPRRSSHPPGRWPERRRRQRLDRKSTRLNSSHGYISYAVFCLKKKKKQTEIIHIYFQPTIIATLTSTLIHSNTPHSRQLSTHLCTPCMSHPTLALLYLRYLDHR